MAEHSKMPWGGSPLSGKFVTSADGDIVAVTYPDSGPVGDANAALIVRAVNAYQPLVEALRAHDAYMLNAGYCGPNDLALHPRAAENWRCMRALLAQIDQEGTRPDPVLASPQGSEKNE